MQQIDYFAGIPLCFGLSLLRRVKNLALPEVLPEPKKILFIELSEMGSAFLAYSSLALAVEKVGKENVYFLIFEKNRESVDLLDIIPRENVITIPDKDFITFALGTLKALAKIRSLGIDTSLDLELFSRATSLISYLSGAKNRVGYDNFTDEGLYRGNFLTHRVMLNNHQHIALNFLALVEALKSDRSELPMLKADVSPLMRDLPHIVPNDTEKNEMWNLLKKEYPSLSETNKIVIINPDPGLLELRGWPVASYRILVEKLLDEDPDMIVALMGLPRSSSYAAKVFPERHKARCIDFCGKTRNLKDVTTLFFFAKLLITNDSGPGHLASLARIPAVVLFGPESPEKYGPLGNTVTSVFANFSCSPCYSPANHRYSLCTNNRCLQAITVPRVHSECLKYLKR